MAKALMTIDGREIGPGKPTYFIAELSANHNQKFEQAVELLEAAIDTGADAVKLQTYTPDTMTLDCDKEMFKIQSGTIWDGYNFYDLFKEAYTPWEWHEDLKKIANDKGVTLFSTPFDTTSVDFLETLDVPAYKIGSFELVDIPLIRRVGQTKKPVIISTGMATLSEIDEAVRTAREAGAPSVALLKTNSSYPAPVHEMNLRTIPHLAQAFDVPSGLSDHTLGIAVPIAAVALGACIVEKHLCLSRDIPGPDSAFSLEPHEFKQMIESVRMTEQALGEVSYELTKKQQGSVLHRRSLFVVKDVNAGEVFTAENVRSIRPADGLHTRYLDVVLGKCAAKSIERGTPLAWEHVLQSDE